MGQNSSKRRSSKSRGKNGTPAAVQNPNGDDPNASIEIRQKRDIGARETSPPTSPTSVSSTSPSFASGKKEKRKRFRVGFSLNRTPSGRWSRKKKTPSQNGTRPVSCPDPLRPELVVKPGRPHSLFLEEVEIPEEDSKVETVDLSDNEENKTKTASEDKSAPKAPERSKWKRGSHKKSSGKKKKKDKQPPKKEKKKKEKCGEAVKPEKSVSSLITSASSNTHENKTEILKSEDPKDVSKIEKQQDFAAIASTIVAEALEIAQNRLQSEIHNDKSNSFVEETVSQQQEISTHECWNNSTEITDKTSNDVPLEIIEETIKSTEKVDLDDVYILDNTTDATLNESSTDMDLQVEYKIDTEVHKSEGEYSQIPFADNCGILEIASDKSEQLITGCSLQVRTDNSCHENSEMLSSKIYAESTSAKVDAEPNVEGDESEAIAKQIVECVLAASLEVVKNDKYVNENSVTDEICNKYNNDGTALHSDSIVGQKCKEQTHSKSKKKSEVKSEKGETERENVDQNAGRKSDKEKSKSESKMKVTKKLSNWFHKKDKQSKAVSGTAVDLPTTETAKTSSLATNSEHTTEHDERQTVEWVSQSTHHDPTVSQPPDTKSSLNTNLTMDKNVSSLDMDNSTLTDSNENHSESLSPSSSISLTNPNSGEVTSSPLSGDGKSFGSSFLKKISIGPRLRTAILRKKSSASSDDLDKNKNVQTPENAEPIVLTPPPRKIRQRKIDNQNLPATPKTHIADSSPDSSPQSPPDVGNSLTESAHQSVSIETNIKTEDSGIADLTSPEIDKSVLSWVGECEDDRAHKVIETAETTSSLCADKLTEHSKDKSQNDPIDGFNDSDNDEDDTRPISQINEAILPESDAHSKSMSSPLQSPTLISTAAIILRSVSNDEGVELPDRDLGTDTNPNLKTQPETSEFLNKNMSRMEETYSASAEPASCYVSYKEHNDNSINNFNERPPVLNNNYKCGQSGIQTERPILNTEQETLNINIVQSNINTDVCETRLDSDVIAPTGATNGKLLQAFSYPLARTVAEYNIGVLTDDASTTDARESQGHLTDAYPCNQTFIKEAEESALESTVLYSWVHKAEHIDSSSIDPHLLATLHEKQSQDVIEKTFQNEINHPLNLYNTGHYDQTHVISGTLDVNNDRVNMSQVTRYPNDVLDTDNSNNNESYEDDENFMKKNKLFASEDYKEKCDVHHQKDFDFIEISKRCNDENERTEPTDVNKVYQTLLNGDLTITDNSSNKNSSVAVDETGDI